MTPTSPGCVCACGSAGRLRAARLAALLGDGLAVLSGAGRPRSGAASRLLPLPRFGHRARAVRSRSAAAAAVSTRPSPVPAPVPVPRAGRLPDGVPGGRARPESRVQLGQPGPTPAAQSDPGPTVQPGRGVLVQHEPGTAASRPGGQSGASAGSASLPRAAAQSALPARLGLLAGAGDGAPVGAGRV